MKKSKKRKPANKTLFHIALYILIFVGLTSAATYFRGIERLPAPEYVKSGEVDPIYGLNEPGKDSITVPDSVKQKADSYIVNRVGEAYFNENYTYLSEFSFGVEMCVDGLYGGDVLCDKASTPDAYWLYYEYKPLSNLLNDGKKKAVRVALEGETVNEYNTEVLDCISDESKCVFNVNEDDALRTAVENGFDVEGKSFHIDLEHENVMYKKLGGKLDHWSWIVTEDWPKDSSHCGREKRWMYVDTSTGAVTGPEQSNIYCSK